jgi:hypothetical protein
MLLIFKRYTIRTLKKHGSLSECRNTRSGNTFSLLHTIRRNISSYSAISPRHHIGFNIEKRNGSG